MNNLYNKIADAVYEGDVEKVAALADEVIANKLSLDDAINLGGIVGLERIGKAFDALEAFLPELMLAGEAMQVLLDKFTPYFEKSNKSNAGTVVIGCAQGDLHDIGMNLVATQLGVNGYKVIKLGTDVQVKRFIEQAEEHNADIIAVSSLLTTSAYYQEELINRLKKDGKREKYKVIVGGGPITPDWAKKIGADGYARTANQAVTLCNKLMDGECSETIIIE
jgi:methylmalonyl-CoA mutase cobalamin-binding domain/chain